VTYRFIAAEKVNHAVALLCRVLRVSRSGFYAWCRREPSARRVVDDDLAGRIATIHAESRGTYGAPRVHAELLEQGVRVSRRRIARLLGELGLEGVSRRRRRRTSVPDTTRPLAPDLVGRDFAATGPNQKWFADLTYVPTWEGYLYLAVVMDAFSRRIVGWAMRDDMRAELVVDALGMAVTMRRPERGGGLIHHSDRGGQYASLAIGRTLAESGIAPSMGARGSALDNAACESVMSTIKCELVNRRSFKSRDQARMACFDYIEAFYNPRRRHSALGYLSPAEFERRHAEAQALLGVAA
jgi:putative transposase